MYGKKCLWVFLCLLAPLLSTGCAPTRLFYFPNNVLYLEPKSFSIAYDILRYPSLNGKMITALAFKTDLPCKGTVIHFHGNFGNVSNHFPQSYYLVRHGFDVMIFDYQGYGGSDGKPTPKNIIEDGIATVRYAQEHNRNPAGGVAVLGQSLGGAVGIVVTAQEKIVKAAIIESTFWSYRSIARHAIGRMFIFWPLYPFYPLFLPTQYDPARFVDEISPRPLMFIHGDKDKIIPLKMSQKLFAKAKEPKELIVIKGAEHLRCRQVGEKELEEKMANFFTKALENVRQN